MAQKEKIEWFIVDPNRPRMPGRQIPSPPTLSAPSKRDAPEQADDEEENKD
jgi:hypothetical protein